MTSTANGSLPNPFTAVADVRLDTTFPVVTPVRRSAPVPCLEDPAAAATLALEPLRARIRPGMSVALTVGSRGLADLAPLVRAIVGWLSQAGAAPFIVPAMGSHGGATADGQRDMLAELGVTPDSVGAPIEATMDTVVVGQLPGGPPVHLDANAAKADAILLFNRVKPHTSFHGPVESGLAKIAAIGLGKQRGAEAIHAFGPARMEHTVPGVARDLVATGRVLGGLATVENARHQVARVAFVEPDGIGGAAEAALLAEARELLPRIPFDELDVLVVDTFGKDKSGSGLDPNVIGRMGIPGVAEPDRPRIAIITTHQLSEASHGNAIGLGQVDLAPLTLFRDVDLHQTYINGLTAGLSGVRRSRMPVMLPTDRDVVAAAIRSCGVPDPASVRLARIHDTLDADYLLVSEALRADVEADPELEWIGGGSVLDFDDDGRLTKW